MRHSIRRISLLTILALLAALAPTAGPALAASFTVNSTADVVDASVGDGTCQTSGGVCTLRAAIQEANARAGADTIQFNISTADPGYNSGLGVWTIQVSLGSFPALSDNAGGTTIDATTQPGGRPSGPKVVVNGSLLAQTTAGFQINTPGNTIRGFVINGFKIGSLSNGGFGVYITDNTSTGTLANGNTVSDNWIGLDAAGTSAVPNTFIGVYIRYGSNNVIRNNVISGNGGAVNGADVAVGLVVNGAARSTNANIVAGNRIGTTADGTAVVSGAPSAEGVFVGNQVSNSVIGGATAADRNIIAGHNAAAEERNGLRIQGIANTGTLVQGNYIGTDLSGAAARANYFGITVRDDVDNLTISGNIISGNTQHGINLEARVTALSGITIQNNLIGVSAAGAPLGNALSGVILQRNGSNAIGVSQVTIRGNTISANGNHGISVGSSTQSGSLYTGITIAGNAIGTAPNGTSGSLALTNAQSGVVFFTGTGNTVGGPAAADRNIIAARNNQTALRLSSANTSGTIVQGNYVGVASNGSSPLLAAAERAAFGVLVEGGSANNTIGPGNVIGFNDTGLQLNGGSGNTVSGNNIGVASGGSSVIGNTQFGVWLLNTTNNTIGGAAVADGNAIAGHGRHGIFVDGASGGNTLARNTISGNTQNGIQLNSAGASGTVVDRNALTGNGQDGLRIIAATGVRITQTTTSNNTGAGINLQSGANGGRAAPTISASLTSGPGGVPRATGTATGCASPGCVVEIFSSATREDGEGPRFIASGTADPSTGAFAIDVPGCDRFLTATARDPSTNNTSSFTTPMVDTISGCSAATPLLSAGTPPTSPASPRTVTAGTSVSYQHTLTNNGGLAGTFTLSAASSPAGWTTAIAPTSVTLGAGQSATVFITVTVPLNAAGGQVETTTVTASSGALSDSESNYSIVAQTFGVDIDGPRSILFALSPGAQDVDFTHTITNTGNGTDTITISAVNATIPGSPTFTVVGGNQCIGLARGASCTKTIRVTLPASSVGGNFTVTATGGGGATESVTDTAFTQSVIPQITTFARRDAFPSETVVFAHTVTNIGTQDGNFTPNLVLPAPLDGWTVTTDAPASFFLAAGASRTVNVTMVVPGISATGAISGTEKTATIQITATESGAQASANDTVRVRLQPQFTFSAAMISPASGLPLSTVVFTHTLQNTSNGDDSYSITVTPSAGLENVTILPASPVSVPRQGSVQVVIRARIRSGTAQSVGVEQLGIAVRSLSLPDPGTQNQTDAVTVLGAAVPSLSVAPGTRTANPGAPARFTYTLTNTGNQSGDFGAPAFTLPSAQPGWTATVVGGSPPACFTNLAAGATCTFDVDITSPANAFAGLSPFSVQVASLTTPAATVASASATVNVTPVPGVTFTPDRSGTTNPSTPISYTHSLTNTGNVTDTFTFSVQAPPGWTAPAPATLSAVPPGAVRSITVSITPPAGLLAGTTGIVTYTVTSGTAPNPSAQVVDTTTIAAIDAATLTPPQQTNSGTAGNPVFFFPTLRNTGSTAIAFDITPVSAGWTSIVTPTTTPILQPGATLPITLSVLIPDGTPINTDNPTTLELRRDGSATVLFTGTYTATTRPLGSLLSPPINTGTALPNATIVYTHTLRNITGQADTFTLRTIATNGWDVSVAPGSVFLEPDETREIQVTVVVPPAKPVGLEDYSYVEVTSVANPAINALGTEITTVGRYAAVQLFDAQSRIVAPGEVVEFQHTLLNQGNALETFTIQAQSEHDWPVEVTVPGGGMVTLLAGASFPVEIRVTVPADVPRDTVDHVLVQASNGAAVASVEHVLFYPPLPPVVDIPVYKVYLPLVDKP